MKAKTRRKLNVYHSPTYVHVCSLAFVNVFSKLLSFLFRIDYYKGNKNLPVYKWTRLKEHFSVEFLAKLLLNSDTAVSSGKLQVCSMQPVGVCHNVTFLVNLDALDDPTDIRADENGTWDRLCEYHKNKGSTTVFKRSQMGSHSNHYKIVRTYYKHSSSPDCTRIITTVQGVCVREREEKEKKEGGIVYSMTCIGQSCSTSSN